MSVSLNLSPAATASQLRPLWCVLVAVVTVLVGCTPGVPSSTMDAPPEVVPEATAKFLADVYARTDAATSARYVWEVRRVDRHGSAEHPDGVLLVRERGAFDRMRQRLESATVLGEPDGRLTPPLRVVVDGDAVYVQPGYLAEALALDADEWIGTASGVRNPGRGTTSAESSPLAQTSGMFGPHGVGVGGLIGPLLVDVTSEVRIIGKIGGTRARGEPVTRLRAHVAGSSLAAAVTTSSTSGDRIRALDDVPIEAWVDREGRLRQIDAAVSETMLLHIELYGYDRSVEVDVPDADEVVARGIELLARLGSLRGA